MLHHFTIGGHDCHQQADPGAVTGLADDLVPRLTAAETNAACAAFRAPAMVAAPAIVARLPGLPPEHASGHAPDADTARRSLATIDRYAETSPDMTMFGRSILEAI